MFHTSDAPSPQGHAIHDQSIELNSSFPVKEAAAAGVKGLIVFQDDNRFFDRIECGTSAAEYFPASFNRSEEHTSELQSQSNLVCRLLLEKKKHQSIVPLHSLTTPWCTAGPGFELGANAAKLIGAKVIRVSLIETDA